MTQETIAFIGGGNMATSLIGGMVASGFDAGAIHATDPLAQRRDELAAEFGISVGDDNADAAHGADVLVLAVKPQVMREVVATLADAAKVRQPVVVSIAAGIAEPDLRRWLGYEAAVVRTMPNTPALVQTGITGMFANHNVTAMQRQQADSVMRAVGKTVWLDDEAMIDAVTAISGSGPAYFFLLMELLVESGTRLGLTREVATELALNTGLGAARMALASTDGPGVLRERVTSPGGTTAAALEQFQAGGLPDLVQTATQAARDRGAQLAAELGKD
jgi:pyrroline-5-carboxylate reductase